MYSARISSGVPSYRLQGIQNLHSSSSSVKRRVTARWRQNKYDSSYLLFLLMLDLRFGALSAYKPSLYLSEVEYFALSIKMIVGADQAMIMSMSRPELELRLDILGCCNICKLCSCYCSKLYRAKAKFYFASPIQNITRMRKSSDYSPLWWCFFYLILVWRTPLCLLLSEQCAQKL